MDEVTKTRIQDWLTGVPCINIEFTGGIPFVQFQSFGLWIPSAWRITYEGKIVASSTVDDSIKAEIHLSLVGQRVQNISVHGPFHDLKLVFENRTELETFSDSQGYENWNLTGGPDRMIIAGPGSSWSAF